MSAHAECGRVGKFDCDVDEYIHRIILEDGDPGEGDVQSPSAWFTEVGLDPSNEIEAAIIYHYGSQWIIARELEDGRWFIEVYPTLADRDERMGVLRAAHEVWDYAHRLTTTENHPRSTQVDHSTKEAHIG
ncbi:hypothetical protein SEA_CASEND_96 [Microbacterium phage Casend]|nr:hypothetical protein SEA_CASEND_96 [Microbacterium phage Casend]